MHGIFAGLMGIFMGIGSLFHGGALHSATTMQTSISGTPQASPSGSMRRGRFMKVPPGDHPFFGTVTGVNGSSLTVSMMRGWHMGRAKNTPNITPSSQTVTVQLDSSTKYTGGSQSDIKANTRIAGFGKTNSDGSLTAVSVVINPTRPSGMPRPSGIFRRGQGYGNNGRGFGPRQ